MGKGMLMRVEWKVKGKDGSMVNCQKSTVGMASALPLLVFRGFTDHAHDSSSPNDAAILADAADGGADLHGEG